MLIVETDFAEVKILHPERHHDGRGFFSEIHNRRALAAAGIDVDFVQDNISLSRRAGTVRGLHFQRGEMAQAKLIQVLRGRLLDVVVDLRRDAPTFGRHVCLEMAAEDWTQVFVPVSFAHGFCTIEPDTEVLYKVSAYYSPAHEGGLMWNDPALGIAWPEAADAAHLSDKDRRYPPLADLPDYFAMKGALKA